MPFTTVNVLILPITSENFSLIFIALLVIFFLLGTIIGYIINPTRRRRNKENPLIETSKDIVEEPKDLGQDIPVDKVNSFPGQNTTNQRYGYNSYWNFYYPNRRY